MQAPSSKSLTMPPSQAKPSVTHKAISSKLVAFDRDECSYEKNSFISHLSCDL